LQCTVASAQGLART